MDVAQVTFCAGDVTQAGDLVHLYFLLALITSLDRLQSLQIFRLNTVLL
jgi:hypothetical protein